MNFLDLVFPKKCLGCKKGDRYICSSCLAKVQRSSQVCFACRRFSPKGITHPSCKHKTKIDGFLTVYRYDEIVRLALIRFKYNFAYDISRELADAFCGEVNRDLIPKNAILVPIPLHTKRQRWRGFNQSQILGKIVAGKLSLGFEPKLIVRIQNNPQQARLDKASRLRNIRGIFAVIKPRDPDAVGILRGKSPVILFDDVCTTGATLEEAAKVLKKEGVKNIWAMSVAR